MRKAIPLPALGLLPALCLALAGCNGQEQSPMAMRGGTIALESIDGASDSVKSRVAGAVAQQGARRQIAVVSRAEPTPYRVKGYLSATGNQVSYVFDVFDTSNRRALRIAGDEPMGRAGSLESLDEDTANRIAARSLEQMAVLFNPGLRAEQQDVPPAAPPSIQPAAAQPQPEPVYTPQPSAPGNAIAYAPQPVTTVSQPRVVSSGTTTLSVQAAPSTGGPYVPLPQGQR